MLPTQCFWVSDDEQREGFRILCSQRSEKTSLHLWRNVARIPTTFGGRSDLHEHCHRALGGWITSHPYERESNLPGADEPRAAARILWESVRCEDSLRKELLKFVQQQAEQAAVIEGLKSKMYDCFAKLCTPEYYDNGFIQSMAEAIKWEATEEPFTLRGEIRVVKGTKCTPMPLINPPSTKLEALFDQRPCFDNLRKGFLGFLGSSMDGWKRALESTVMDQYPHLARDTNIMNMVDAVQHAERMSEDTSRAPEDVLQNIWPHYLRMLEHGGAGMTYWLEANELLAAATIAKVPLVILQQYEDRFTYSSSNVADLCAECSREPIFVSARADSQQRVESHFERVVLAEELL